MKIKDVMTRDVESVDPMASLEEAAQLMSDADVGSVPVVDEGRVVGVLTDRDIVVRAAAAGLDLSEARAGDFSFLVKDELAAAETYKQALEKVGAGPAGPDLMRIEAEHEEAARLLQKRMRDMGRTPPDKPGLWGAFAEAVQGAAKLFGAKAAIKALKEGEEHGIHDYEDALEDERVPAEVKELISTTLLPRTRAHLPVLDRHLRAGN
jgi:CBS domain-containing protein